MPSRDLFATRFYEGQLGDADLLSAIAAEAEWLAGGDDARFMNDVALRLQG